MDKPKEQLFTWKSTLEDGTVPVYNISDLVKESEKKDLTNFTSLLEMESEKFLKHKIDGG